MIGYPIFLGAARTTSRAGGVSTHSSFLAQTGLLLPQKSIRRPLVTLSAALTGCAALAAFLWGAADNESLWAPIGICSGVAVLALIAAIRSLGFEWLSGPVVYLVYLWLFHFPLALITCLSPEGLVSIQADVYRWTLVPNWYRAVLIALACASAFTAGVSLLSGRRSSARAHPAPPPDADYWLGWMGTAEALAGGGMVVYSILQGGGSRVFDASYMSLYNSLFSELFSYGIMIFTIGISTALAGIQRKYFRLVVGIQVVWSCAMLLLGARTAALLGSLVAVMIMSKRGVKIPRLLAIAALVTVLWVIAVVGAARKDSVREGFAEASSSSPVSALAEMGASLYTVSLFDQWVSNGDPLQRGAGYWLPFERALGFVLPSARSDLGTDPRAPSEVLGSRSTGLGGSVVAEADYNFGPFAPVLVFVPLALLIAYLDRAALTPMSIAWFAVLFYPLLAEVRGWFLSVPVMCAIGAAPLLILSLAKRARARKAAAPRMTTPGGHLC